MSPDETRLEAALRSGPLPEAPRSLSDRATDLLRDRVDVDEMLATLIQQPVGVRSAAEVRVCYRGDGIDIDLRVRGNEIRGEITSTVDGSPHSKVSVQLTDSVGARSPLETDAGGEFTAQLQSPLRSLRARGLARWVVCWLPQ